ncbi:tripartite tricarboxylate transporter TctB family protein [Ochrobactrum quorumnocens]|uniref:Tripartite tricarboxylate transporter TctB family protein n=1 Tax=Ochrobactrum quorumnocens TaxID=271865 RepID=A0A248U954_9HYPH|nr:tripartite tricarboxylate transporter TctB family protein [[Ochrobactrum] quorumnocens]ASV83122.1 tripartite tricarboxylate transporter TctB family protein [[Ochrobactrum] quorumnocens]
MLSRDYRDIVGGILLVALGLAFSWYAAVTYELGTLRRMGPGMFPTALGIVLAGFGLVIVIPAFFRTGVMPEIRVWTPIYVLTGVAAFAIMIRPLGLIPAVLGVVVISSFAELRVKPLSLTILSTALCLIAWLVFRVGLGLPVALFRWPF